MATVGGTSRYPGLSPSQTRGTSQTSDLETSSDSVLIKQAAWLLPCLLIFIGGGVPTHEISFGEPEDTPMPNKVSKPVAPVAPALGIKLSNYSRAFFFFSP
jgi:hypothetical protein